MLHLRPWHLDDLQSLAHHANNLKIAACLTDAFPHPYTHVHAQAFINNATNEAATSFLLAIDVQGQAVGSIGIHPLADIHRKNAELGYWLSEEYWGQGILPKVIPQMVSLAFARLDIDRIFARPFGSNARSMRVLEKSGFVLEARFEKTLIKLGRLEDELVYAVRRNTWNHALPIL